MIHNKRPVRRALVALAFGLAVLAAGCSSNDATTSGTTSGSTSDMDLGAEVYARSCASCHGTELQGTPRGPSHLSIVYEPNHHGDDAFRSAIANGSAQHHWPFGDMPAIEGLSPAEVDAVIAYVRAEQERQGFQQ